MRNCISRSEKPRACETRSHAYDDTHVFRILLFTGKLQPWVAPPTLEDDGVEVVGTKSAEDLKPSVERIDLTCLPTPVRTEYFMFFIAACM